MLCYTSEVGFSEFMTNYVLRNSHPSRNFRSGFAVPGEFTDQNGFIIISEGYFAKLWNL